MKQVKQAGAAYDTGLNPKPLTPPAAVANAFPEILPCEDPKLPGSLLQFLRSAIRGPQPSRRNAAK